MTSIGETALVFGVLGAWGQDNSLPVHNEGPGTRTLQKAGAAKGRALRELIIDPLPWQPRGKLNLGTD